METYLLVQFEWEKTASKQKRPREYSVRGRKGVAQVPVGPWSWYDLNTGGKEHSYTGYSVCGHQVPCHRLTGALVRCNHPGGPKALNK
jgi:hypothetical protein